MNKVDSHIIRTPIDTLNILGCGGIKAGTIVMAYGAAGSGKSTFFAQTCGIYQKDNPDAVIHYIDVENSVDLNRLKYVMKLDMDRTHIHHTPVLEGAFKLILDIAENMTKQQIGKYKNGKKEIKLLTREKLEKLSDEELFKYCQDFRIPSPVMDANPFINANDYGNDRTRVIKALGLAGGYTMPEFGGPIPTIILWDSIAVSRPEAVLEKVAEGNMAKNAAGMNVATQVISDKLSLVLGSQGGKPLTLFMPNQVRLKNFGSFLGPQEGFAGSYALEHNCHYIVKFTKINNKEARMKNFDEDDQMKTGTDIFMQIEKTKFCPATGRVDLYINDALGGLMIPMEELAHTAENLNILQKVHGGYVIPNSPFEKLKWTKEEDPNNYISGNLALRKYLMQEVTKHYRMSYYTLDLAYKEAGLDHFGKPSEEDLAKRKTRLEAEMIKELDDNPFM